MTRIFKQAKADNLFSSIYFLCFGEASCLMLMLRQVQAASKHGDCTPHTCIAQSQLASFLPCRHDSLEQATKYRTWHVKDCSPAHIQQGRESTAKKTRIRQAHRYILQTQQQHSSPHIKITIL